MQKLTFDNVYMAFKQRGYELLEQSYLGSKEKMRFICPNHPNLKNSITYGSLRDGTGCPHCFNEKRKETRRFTYEFVNEYFTNAGYELLETHYVNSATKMKYKCPHHPDEINEMAFRQFKYGIRCPLCKKDKFIASIVGENNPSWNGGITDLSERLRRELKDWKRKTLEENHFLCFVTGKTSKYLVVHHEIPFHLIRDKVLKKIGLKLKTTVLEYSDNDLENIIAEFKEEHKKTKGYPLLSVVHKEFHKKYGFNANEKQLLIFKKEYQQK